ncbi:MAG: hypothetical protein AAGA53_08805 [Pseudomonadota bacterium]
MAATESANSESSGWFSSVWEPVQNYFFQLNDLIDQYPLLGNLITWEAIAAIAFVVSALVYLYHWISAWIKISTIRKAAGDKIVILIARFHNDKRSTFQKLIQGHIRDHLNQHGNIAVQSYLLPQKLSSVGEGRPHQRAKHKAQAWLKKVNGDILIWGDDLREGQGSVGRVFFLGRNREQETFTTQTLDVISQKEAFLDAFLDVIDHELTAVRDLAYREPHKVKMYLLKNICDKYEALAESSSKAIPDEWREARAKDAQRMRNAIVSRLEEQKERTDFRLKNEQFLRKLDLENPNEALLWADTACAIARAERRDNFYNLEHEALHFAVNRLRRACSIYEKAGTVGSQADSLFEIAECLYLCMQVGDKKSIQTQEFDRQLAEAVSEFVSLTKTAEKVYNFETIGSPSKQDVQFFALLSMQSKQLELLSDHGVNILDPSSFYEWMSRGFKFLDPEALYLATAETSQKIMDHGLKKSHPVPILKSQEFFGQLFNGHISGNLIHLANLKRFSMLHKCEDGLVRLQHIEAERINHRLLEVAKESLKSADVIKPDMGDFFYLQCVQAFPSLSDFVLEHAEKTSRSPEVGKDLLDRVEEAILRYSGKFPTRTDHLQSEFVVGLNNMANLCDDFDAAQRAFDLAKIRLGNKENATNCHELQIFAYAASHRARLTDPMNRELRNDRAQEAWFYVENAEKVCGKDDIKYKPHALRVSKLSLKEWFPNLFSDKEVEPIEGDKTIEYEYKPPENTQEIEITFDHQNLSGKGPVASSD